MIKLHESDLEEKFIIGSGPGGQSLQKTASCVWLKHIPTGIEVKCQKSRSRADNRRIAREILAKTLFEKEQAEKQREKAVRAKMKRDKRVRSKAQKAKLVATKRKHSLKKSLRHTPSND